MLLKLVKKINQARDTKSFFFSKPNDFNFQAGQYLYLTLGDTTKQFTDEVGQAPLTIATSPTEKLIQVTTRIRSESEFKQKLDSLAIGTEIEARAPFGTFVLDSSHLVPNAFYVVGPPAFVNAMEDILEELKIPQDNIKTEKFIGY